MTIHDSAFIYIASLSHLQITIIYQNHIFVFKFRIYISGLATARYVCVCVTHATLAVCQCIIIIRILTPELLAALVSRRVCCAVVHSPLLFYCQRYVGNLFNRHSASLTTTTTITHTFKRHFVYINIEKSFVVDVV